MSAYDVIVIGAGHNGLVAAERVARQGRRVLVLERSDAIGGLARGDEFHDGFVASGPLVDTTAVRSDIAPSLARVDDEPVFIPQHDGPGLLLHRDPNAAADEIARHSSADATQYRRYHDFIDRIRPVIASLLDEPPPALFGDGAPPLMDLAGKAIKMRRLGREDLLELLRVAPMCLADWLNEWFECELLRCALAAPALNGLPGGPWAPQSVANLLRHEVLGTRAIRGGAAALIDALERDARDAGVEIRTGASVTAIHTEGGVVRGVTVDGTPIDATTVIATCDPKQVFLDLVAPAALSPSVLHHVATLRSSGTAATVDLALRGSLRFDCRSDLDVRRARIVGPTLDDMERAADPVKYGEGSPTPLLEIDASTERAPDGHCTVSIVAHHAPADPATYETFGDAVVDVVAEHAAGIRENIVARRVRSPRDLAEHYGMTGGHVHHLEHGLDQLLVRPIPQAPDGTTPIRGLILGGSGCHPGGGLTGRPGALAADAAL